MRRAFSASGSSGTSSPSRGAPQRREAWHPFRMADVIVIGAGLAGLNCAGLLHAHGLDVEVVEASDGVGGRVRTDVVDGFRLDRGFQVLFDGYPEAQRALDLDALDLKAFLPGADIWWDGRMRTIGHPLRDPRSIPQAARAGLGGPADIKAAAKWLREARPLATATAPEITADERLRQLGFSEPVREHLLRPLSRLRHRLNPEVARLRVLTFPGGTQGSGTTTHLQNGACIGRDQPHQILVHTPVVVGIARHHCPRSAGRRASSTCTRSRTQRRCWNSGSSCGARRSWCLSASSAAESRPSSITRR